MSDTQNGGTTQKCVCENCEKCKASLASMQALPAIVAGKKRCRDYAVVIAMGSLVLVLISLGSIPHVGLAVVMAFSFLIIFCLAVRRLSMFDGELKKLEEEMKTEHLFAVAQVRFLDGSVRNEMHDENAIRATKHGPRIGFSGPVISKRAFVFSVSANNLADGSREIRGEAYGVNEEERAITGQCYPDLWIETIAYMFLAGLEGSSYVRIVARREEKPAPDKSTRNSRCTEIYYGIDKIFEVLPDFLEVDASDSIEPFVRQIASVKALQRENERLSRNSGLLHLIVDQLAREIAFTILFLRKTENGGVYNTPAGPVLATHEMFVLQAVARQLKFTGIESEIGSASWIPLALQDSELFALLDYVRTKVVGQNVLGKDRLDEITATLEKWQEPVRDEMMEAGFENTRKGKDKKPLSCPVCSGSIGKDETSFCHNCKAYVFGGAKALLMTVCSSCEEGLVGGPGTVCSNCKIKIADTSEAKLPLVVAADTCPKCGSFRRTVTDEGDACGGCGLSIREFEHYPREGSIVAGMLVVANGSKNKK